MTNTVKITVKQDLLRFGNLRRQTPAKVYSVETTSELISVVTQVVGTTHEVLAAGDVTDDAMAVIENNHATAVISVGGDDTGVFVEWFTIEPGDPPAIIPRVSALADLYLKSDTAATPIEISLYKIVAPA